MPGNPPMSPRFGAPRYADTDDVSFSTQVNSVTDAFDARVAAQNAACQVGDLIASVASSRHGCLLSDGSAVSRTTYSALFAVISTRYGSGDGSTTFNLPDFRGKTIVGAGTGPGLTARTLGQSGGEENHTLTDAQIPPTHVTAQNDGGVPPLLNDGGQGQIFGSEFATGGTYSLATTGGGAFFFGLQVAGGGGAHNNMQPFGVANVFIFTGVDAAS